MQSINLYTAEFQPDRSPLRAGQMLLACAAFCLLLVLVSLWYRSGTSELAGELEALSGDNLRLAVERDALARASNGADAESLASELAQVRALIKDRLALADMLAREDMGNAGGFSAQLVALARLSEPSLSLSEFSLSDAGRYVTLEGLTAEPAAVPRYLERLQGEDAFAGSAFGVLSLAPDDGKGYPFAVKAPAAGGSSESR